MQQIQLIGEEELIASAQPSSRLVRLRRTRISSLASPQRSEVSIGDVQLFNADALSLYEQWDQPTVIVADGPYGIGGFPGDPPTVDSLCDWYEPHVRAWSRFAAPSTTL